MVASLRPTLRLTTDDYAAISFAPAPAPAPSPAPRGADRRMFPRKTWRASVEACRLDHSIPARQQPRLTMDLRDLSVGGLSALIQLPLARGERVAVFFPPEGIQRGWNAFGQVVRCEPTALGYRVALEFDPLPSAA